MTATVEELVIIETTSCCACGVVFGMPEDMLATKRRTGGGFYCPNGHSLSFKKTEIDRLREELAAVTRQRDAARVRAVGAEDQAAAERKSHAATKGQLTRIRKRVAVGTCPACHSSFPDLAAHMAEEHPTYSNDEHADISAEDSAGTP